jgi:hypothetical protein
VKCDQTKRFKFYRALALTLTFKVVVALAGNKIPIAANGENGVISFYYWFVVLNTECCGKCECPISIRAYPIQS